MSPAHRARVRRRTLFLRRPAVVLNGTAGTPRLPALEHVAPAELAPNTVLFVGALHERKGLDVLLHAMAKLLTRVPTARLCVVGNRDAPRFEHLAESLSIADRVDFVGFTPDPRTFMLAATVFVLPSRQEGFGNVLTEARECGAAIVASRVGGIPDALSGGGAGLLVDSDDPAALAEAIASVLLDEGLAASLRASTSAGLEYMRPARAAQDYEAVYRSLVPTRHPLATRRRPTAGRGRR